MGIANRVRFEEPGLHLFMLTFCTLGYGLPAAIGAKVADPDRPALVVLGDGALGCGGLIRHHVEVSADTTRFAGKLMLVRLDTTLVPG